MDNKKKLTFFAGAALAAFSAGSLQAADLTKTLDLSQGVLVAEGDAEHHDAEHHDAGKKAHKDKKHKHGKKDGEKSCGGKKDGGEKSCGGEGGCSHK